MIRSGDGSRAAVRLRTGPGEIAVVDGQADHFRRPAARNTGENIRLSRSLLEKAGVNVASVLLISKPYEERRAYATARKMWPEVEVVSASTTVTFEHYRDTILDTGMVFDMLAGALQRILAYPQKWFTVYQEVPAEVAAAYERLCAEGYSSRLAR
ncbi:ElyC/SanA/YdcF family protein [Streptomyces halstedii]|uniref:ElyC/SanA/YdcF family protein n=1 Tax=Streptomyces halstedii TaxID=1944 RepID=UPI003F4DA82B